MATKWLEIKYYRLVESYKKHVHSIQYRKRPPSPRYFDMILYVFVDTRPWRGKIWCSSALRRISLHETCAHRTPRAGAKLASFTSLSFCKFKLRFVFIHSGARWREVELGSVLLSVRHASLHGARVLSWVFLHLVFECFKLFLEQIWI